MSNIDYNDKRFRSVTNSATGEVGGDTVFYYHQSDNIVTAEFSGGEIVSGHLIAVCHGGGQLDMRYYHVNSRGELMTGVCRSTPEMLDDGRIRLHETWQWTSGNMSAGTSVLEEIANLG